MLCCCQLEIVLTTCLANNQMKDGHWYTREAKEREVTPGARKCAFDLCWHSGKLCRAASTLTNEEEGISDMRKQELVALVSMMYETIAECSELLELELVSGVKEKMRLNKEKYDEQECKVSNRILMQNTL